MSTSFFLPGLRRRTTRDDLYGPAADGTSSSGAPAPLSNSAFAPPGTEIHAALAPVRSFPKPGATPSAAAYAPPSAAPQPMSTPVAYQPYSIASPTGSSVAPYMGQSAAFAPPPKSSTPDYGSQLADIEQKLSAAYAAPKPGLARQIIGGVLTGMNPRNPLGSYVSGAAQRQQQIQPLTDQYSLLSSIIQANRAATLGDATLNKDAAETDMYKAHTDYFRNPKQQRVETPDQQAIDDLTTKTNPTTGQNYTPYEARVKLAQDIQDVKPDNEKGQLTDLDVGGQNHKVLVNTKTGKSIADLGRSKLPTVNPSTNDNRLDRSYQYNNSILEKIRKPIDDRTERLDRAVMSVNQKTPQADAVVAPELLTVMAGGSGSGLRMNEAEIERIVGGRSNWESLKAAANKWQTDPSKALSITDSQRGQVLQLLNQVKSKAAKKQAVIDAAGQELIGANDVGQHRSIIQKAHKSLSDIDNGPSGDSTSTGSTGNALPSFAQWKAQQGKR